MTATRFSLLDERPGVVGSFGSRQDLSQAAASQVRAACDLAEIRLDLIAEDRGRGNPPPWRHLRDIPLLFTARRPDEGGAHALDAATRSAMLTAVLDEAACLDIEVNSLDEMTDLRDTLAQREIPWLASFHDFSKLPDPAILLDATQRARAAGAAAFKVAALVRSPAELARLAEFQLMDHGLPVATMGMGPLAAVSRLLCAQCGSVLNYGYLGETATAPGQWDAASLRQTIARLVRYDR